VVVESGQENILPQRAACTSPCCDQRSRIEREVVQRTSLKAGQDHFSATATPTEAPAGRKQMYL